MMKKSQYFDRFWLFNNLSAEIFSCFFRRRRAERYTKGASIVEPLYILLGAQEAYKIA